MTTAAGQATGFNVLAGSPGQPPSPAAVAVVLAVIAIAFGVIAFASWTRRQQEDALRNEIRARPMTYHAPVDVKANVSGQMVAQNGPLYLNVHGDAFEVLHALAPARWLFGQDYCYRGRDTTVEMVPGWRHDWIRVCGTPGTGAVPIQIGRRKMNRLLWDVLLSTGAQPIGPPPPPSQAQPS